MIIKKRINDYDTFDIDIIDNGKKLSIFQTGADITLSCRYEDYCDISHISFDIFKEQEDLYLIFNKLYTDIVNGNVLGEDINLKTTQESMDLEKRMSWYSQIVKDGIITVMCDAYPINCPNTIRIKKEQDKIVFEFEKSIGPSTFKVPYYISINIRQSGSRIYDFCIPFNTMYKQLQKIPFQKEPVKELIKK